jgi:hypothetical protein
LAAQVNRLNPGFAADPVSMAATYLLFLVRRDIDPASSRGIGLAAPGGRPPEGINGTGDAPAAWQ